MLPGAQYRNINTSHAAQMLIPDGECLKISLIIILVHGYPIARSCRIVPHRTSRLIRYWKVVVLLLHIEEQGTFLDRMLRALSKAGDTSQCVMLRLCVHVLGNVSYLLMPYMSTFCREYFNVYSDSPLHLDIIRSLPMNNTRLNPIRLLREFRGYPTPIPKNNECRRPHLKYI